MDPVQPQPEPVQPQPEERAAEGAGGRRPEVESLPVLPSRPEEREADEAILLPPAREPGHSLVQPQRTPLQTLLDLQPPAEEREADEGTGAILLLPPAEERDATGAILKPHQAAVEVGAGFLRIHRTT